MARQPDMHGLIGLTSRETARILGEEGPNELTSSKQRGNLRIALDVTGEPTRLTISIMILRSGCVCMTGGKTSHPLDFFPSPFKIKDNQFFSAGYMQ
jgi:hypothetical protein